MHHKSLTVCKANKVTEAGYKLSLNEQRIILACIAQVNSLEELFKTDRFELTAKDFAKLYGIAEDKAYQTLKEIAEQLFERYVIIDNPDPDEPTLKYTKTRWVSSIDYIPEKGKIAVYFAVRMLPYLGKLRGEFTKYKLEHVGKMTSIYAIRLYELLVQWQKTGNREVEIDWLKKQFEIEDGYNSMCDFKKRVLDPAVKDINEHSNLQVSWTQRKSGRRVTHFIFTFAEKQPAKPQVAPEPKERTIMGVSESDIKKQAKVGESWEQAAARIKAEQRETKAN
jgi:plasmid replication initiation protein